MGISLISISHQNAPLAIRELFAFPEMVQKDFMHQMLEQGYAKECVMISTCNRTEVYTYSERTESNFTDMQNLLLELQRRQRRKASAIMCGFTAERRQ